MRLAIFGTSEIVRRAILRPLRRLPEGSVEVLLIGHDDSRTARFAETNGISHWSTSREDAFRPGAADAAYIALPNLMHADVAISAARAHLPTLVEKPICLSGAEFSQVADVAADTGTYVSEAVMLLHHRWLFHLASLRDRYGPVKRTRTHIWFKVSDERLTRIPPARLGGGILYDVSSYWLAITQCIVGLDVVEHNLRVVRAKNGSDLEITARMVLRSGTVAELSAGYGAYRANHEIDFSSTTVRVPDFLRPAAGTASLRVVLLENGKEVHTTLLAASSYYVNQLLHFTECVQSRRHAEESIGATSERICALDRFVPALLSQLG